jgi:hypothetical protein
MIRTKCPRCGKLLGINDGAAGTVAQCPMCEQKFRVPVPGGKAAGPPAAKSPAAGAARAPARPPVKRPVEEFPEVEVDEEAEQVRRPPPARAGKRPAPVEEDEEVAELDSEDAEEDQGEERPKPKKGSSKKKRKRGRDLDQEKAAMILRNRIVGSVGAVGGIALAVVGVAKWLPATMIDPQVSVLGKTAEYMWLAPTLFGALMVMVGVYYVFKTD